MAGLKAARARGRHGGRKRKLTDRQIQQAKILLSNPNVFVSDVARSFGVSRMTIYRWCGAVKPDREVPESLENIS
jgi:DNA invertase Pin-like site-specific DNA recombinase